MKNKRFLTDSLIVVLGLVIMFIASLLAYRIWFIPADSTIIPQLGISYPNPIFQSTADIPDWRIVTPKNFDYPFLEVFNQEDINYALGEETNQYPVFKINYFVTNSGSGITKEMLIIPLPKFDYLKNPTSKYYSTLSYSAKSNDAADKILKRIQTKANNSDKDIINRAIESYQQAIAFSKSKVRRQNDQTIYYRDEQLIKMQINDPDVRYSNSFPPNTDIQSLEISINTNHIYEAPRNNSPALAILIDAKAEAEQIGDIETAEKINLAIINYQQQIQPKTGKEPLKLSMPINMNQNSSKRIDFSLNKNSLPYAQPDYLQTLELKVNSELLCKISFSSSEDKGAVSFGNCNWDQNNLTGTAYLSESITRLSNNFSEYASHFLIASLEAFNNNSSFGLPVIIEAAAIYK